MAVCQYGLGVGADLVGDLTGLPQHPVTAHDDQVDLAPAHEKSGGRVRDDLVADALLSEFPSGERGTLAPGAGFIAVHVKLSAGSLGRIHRSRGRTDVDEGQPSGVAVSQHPHAISDEGSTVFAQCAAMLDVFLRESGGCCKCNVLALGNCFAHGHLITDGIHGIDRIHSRGARLLECLVHRFDVCLETVHSLAPKGASTLSEAVGGCRSDGSGTPDYHGGDGFGGFPVVAGLHQPEVMG